MGLKNTVRHYGERLQQLASFAAEARQHKSVPAQFADLLVHKLRINTFWRDYYRLEFYKSGKSWDEKSRYVGLYGSRYYPHANNSIKYVYLFNNKLVTKILLAGFDLPQPTLLATIGKDYEIRSRDEFNSFLSSMEQDVVLKPLSDLGGRGVLVLTYTQEAWLLAGHPCSADEVWEQVRSGLKAGYLAEERVRNTEQLAAIYPHSVNTIRVVTIKTLDGRWHATHGGMRVGRGGKSVDNVGAGGMIVSIDSDGTTFQAYDFARSKPLTHHPDTGAPLIGIQIDGYHAAVSLGLRAAERFGFMGIIGWDIALTDNGPLIVEGNALPGTWHWQRGAAGPWLTEEMARGLKQRGPFTRWDKTKIYPAFNPYRIKA